MNQTRFCGSCGAEIAPSAGFCSACGADQSQFETAVTPVVEPIESKPTSRVRTPEPRPAQTAGELARELRSALGTPGVIAALLSALLGGIITFGVAVALAAIFPDESQIGLVGTDVSLFKESAAQAVQLVAAGFVIEDELTLRFAPAILVVIPILGCALGAALQARNTLEMPPRARLVWGAATGIPFGLLMLIPALSSGSLGGPEGAESIEPSVVGSVLLGFLWGAVGGSLGALFTMRRDTPDVLTALLPERGRTSAGVAGAILKPFGVGLLVAGVLATGLWIVQTIRDEGDTRAFDESTDRSLALALVENSLLLGDNAVSNFELGAGVEFRRPRSELTLTEVSRPLPIGSGSYFTGDANDEGSFDVTTDANEFFYSGTYRVFQYSDATEPYIFIPMLVVLIAIPAVLALYAGFAGVRRSGTSSLGLGAAIGALVGPVWATAAVLLTALVAKDVVAKASGDSVFVMFLLGGAALGAVGGLLASQSAASPGSGTTGAS